jgi:peptidoglycan/xylan/chitin deacetylase (PgdA/CDA1 family)
MILLSFDIEEFDMPFEYQKDISFEDQMQIAIQGTKVILSLLSKHQIQATFFCTATFAINAPEIMKQIIVDGHEVASHSYHHGSFNVADLKTSREKLEEITKTNVIGYRMPRMQPVDEKEVFKAGYVYNTSLNPTYLPGRYNNFLKPRTYFKQAGVWQIPTSVSPWVRFPLFWLSFHNLPLKLYQFLCSITLKKDGYLNLYFHPWEFTDIKDKSRFGFPDYISKNSGDEMITRMDHLIIWMKQKKYSFHNFKDLIAKIEVKT